MKKRSKYKKIRNRIEQYKKHNFYSVDQLQILRVLFIDISLPSIKQE